MPAMFALYNFIVRSNREISARQGTIQQWYEFFERLNIMMQDYTIDYEEYYNRQMVWCTEWGWTWSAFTWTVSLSGYCSNFTAYWNKNSVTSDSGYHNIYYCSSELANDGNDNDWRKVIWRNHCWRVGSQQSYWQFKALFIDVHGDTESDANTYWYGNRIWDADDEDMWNSSWWSTTINAIIDADNIQELYFISHDWKSRLYFRRALVNTWNDSAQYKIQLLRLRWFDAWEKHSFDETVNNPWLYDWVTDTWACDYWMWFEWHWDGIWTAYSWYKLPLDVNDCWIDLTHWSTTVSAWNIIISPTTDSDLAWAKDGRQINAFMKILTVNWVYVPYYIGKMSDSIKDFKVPLETTINMKDFYRN